ncbi:MAG TPA: DUF4157 domain-containing protein [Chthoniobacterales bacterium]
MKLTSLQKSKCRKPRCAAAKRKPRRPASGPALSHPIVQAKLRIGASNDRFEQEADRMADAVMKTPKPVSDSAPAFEASSACGTVQRKCAACSSAGGLCPECAEEEKVRRQPNEEEEEEEEELQAKAAPGKAPRLDPSAEAQIHALRGCGQPLPQSERLFFEPRFRTDFSQVRLHIGAAASAAARAVSARAFATGSDIAFAHGQYAPETSLGRRLLAHELAHVVQQRRSRHSLGGHTLQRQEPTPTQTPLQKLDADLASSWTLDSTLLSDLAALSSAERAVVLTGTKYRDQLIERLDTDDLRTALTTLDADYMTWRDWLTAAGVTLFSVVPVPEFLRSTPDGTLDVELEKRMMNMCRYLILNEGVTDNIRLDQGARSKKQAHIKSTTYHIIKGRVTLKDLQALLAPATKPKQKPKTHTAQPGDSLSLIAGYPNPGWQDRLAQLIAANPDLPNIKNRTPDDPRYGWLDIGDVITIPWEAGGEENVPDPTAPLEVRDLDNNLWYVAGWAQEETNAQARKNRGLKPGEDPSLAYEGYGISEKERLPNSLDPTHPPISEHVFGLAMDVRIPWSEKTWRGNPDFWADSVAETIKSFQLQRPIDASNPYGPSEAEPWHFEKL